MLWYIYLFVFVELVAVAWIDFKTNKIANYWTLLNIVFFVLFTFLLPSHYQFGIKTFFLPLVFIFAGYMLFTLNIMGAGDSKYLFSIFLLIPRDFQDLGLYTLIYSTVLVGLSSLLITVYQNIDKIIRAYRTKDIKLIKGIFGKKFTFAPVILFSWIWFGYLVKIWR